MNLELTTARLRLRLPLASDAEFLFPDICCKRTVLQFVSWQPPSSLEKAGSWVVERARMFKHEKSYTWIATTTNEQPLGVLELSPKEGVAEIGFLFAEWCWGQGYATEAVAGIIVADAGQQTIQAVCHRDNLASLRVLQKTGFRKLAVVPANDRPGSRRDSFLFEYAAS
jgi:RimJ/RimL family protein N-acetyltransferase